jgi:phosphate transport system permease protein
LSVQNESENDVLLWGCLLLIVIAGLAHFATMRQATALRAGGQKLHSLPAYHGYLAAASALLTGLLALIISFRSTEYAWLIAALVAAAVGAFVFLQSRPKLAARDLFEKIVLTVLIACSAVAILTTIGIFASVVFESLAFFREVNVMSFLFGTLWAPTGTPPSFGFIPLLVGTFLITAIAIVVAAPLGLLSAIYMAEYASPRVRSVAKPLLEMLAGIPTVVLGFFAALTVAPLIRNWGQSFGLDVASESALAAGLVMGMMIVPLISSLSDDIINSVPQSLRDGALAMGSTKSETIKRVVLPAALPGIVSAVMLAISRAVGETMIVVMAAGLAANLSFNPLDAVSTITVQIATLLVGDQEFDSAKTLSAFALGLVLFFFTLALNYLALRIVQKYRQQYD